jgi:spermidine synthase
MTTPHVSEQDGIRNMHFGTPAIQGAMRISEPFSLEFEYIQQMMVWTLFTESFAHIVQLGLGAGSLTKFCYRNFQGSLITAIELDPVVIELCRADFSLPADDERLCVLAMDAMEYVTDPANRGTVDILQIDLYDAQALAPALQSLEFYQACMECLAPEGILTVNLFCDYPDRAQNLQHLEQVFAAVAWLPEVHDGNVVAIAFKHNPLVDFDRLYVNASLITRQLKLPAKDWVDGLMDWMQSTASSEDPV